MSVFGNIYNAIIANERQFVNIVEKRVKKSLYTGKENTSTSGVFILYTL